MLQPANPLLGLRGRVSLLALSIALTPSASAALAQDSSEAGPKPTEPEASAAVSVGAGISVGGGAAAGADQSPDRDAMDAGEQAVDMEAWKRRYRRYNTLEGSTGGIHMLDPVSGAPGSVRIQLALKGFSTKDFMVESDEVQRVAETLSVSWTAIELLEAYASIAASSTTSNLRDFSSDEEDRRLENDFHAVGDGVLGAKVGAEVATALSLGGDLALMLPNASGAVGLEPEGIGVRLRGNLSTDLRNLESRVPLIGRFSLSYLFDHSELLVEETEKRRYETLPEDGRLSRERETRHLLSRVERFGMGVNRVDMLSLGLGLEVPLEVATDFDLNPLLEWHWGFPFNRRDYGCPLVPEPEEDEDEELLSDADALLRESCLEEEGASAFPMILAAGVRVITPIRGLSALLGANIGLTGTSTFVRELAPTPPYEVLFAVGYDYDARPPEVKVVEKPVEPSLPPTGRIAGLVKEDGVDTPVSEATVRFADSELSPLQSAEDGSFVSYQLPPGRVQMEVSHPDFEQGYCEALIPEQGGDVETRCTLSRLPTRAKFNGQVVDIWNMPVPGAVVKFTGPVALSASSDENGKVEQDLPPGDYAARAEAPGYFVRVANVSIAPRQPASLELVLVERPDRSSVKLEADEIRLKKGVRFVEGTSELESASAPVVAELADLLLRSPNIRRIKIWGPSQRSDKDEIMGLTRALAAKQRLVNAGVSAERVQAAGGSDDELKITIEEQY